MKRYVTSSSTKKLYSYTGSVVYRNNEMKEVAYLRDYQTYATSPGKAASNILFRFVKENPNVPSRPGIFKLLGTPKEVSTRFQPDVEKEESPVENVPSKKDSDELHYTQLRIPGL